MGLESLSVNPNGQNSSTAAVVEIDVDVHVLLDANSSPVLVPRHISNGYGHGHGTGYSGARRSLPTSLSTSAHAPPFQFPIPNPNQVQIPDVDLNESTRLERRRRQTLLVAIVDLLTALGLLTYHIDRIITYYRPIGSQQEQDSETGKTDYTSPLVIALWTITFSIILLHIGTASSLLSCSYSVHCTDLSESSRTAKHVSMWIVCSQLLMTIWIVKLTVYTATFQFGYEIGVFNIIVEDYSSIWFVLLFYVGLVVFRAVGIYFVRKYMRELG